MVVTTGIWTANFPGVVVLWLMVVLQLLSAVCGCGAVGLWWAAAGAAARSLATWQCYWQTLSLDVFYWRTLSLDVFHIQRSPNLLENFHNKDIVFKIEVEGYRL